MALSLRQQRFVEAYLAEPNGAKAAIAAGYSEVAARTQSSRLLKHPEIARAIGAARQASEQRAAAHADRAVVTDERIVEELARIAFGDIGRVMAWSAHGVAVVPSEELDPEQTAAIADITESRQGRETRVSLKMHNKMQALTLLARIRGLLDRRGADEPAGDETGGIADDADPPIAEEEETGQG